MKELLLILFLGLIINTNYGQKSKQLCYVVDEFDDSKYLDGGNTIMYTDGGDLKSQGISFRPRIIEKKGKIIGISLILTVYDKNIICCDKNNTLDIIFEGGEKMKLVNWNDFDCKGVNYFDISDEHNKQLKTNRIKGVRYTDKRDFNEITIMKNLSEENKIFFMDLLMEIDKINSGELTIGTCEE